MLKEFPYLVVLMFAVAAICTLGDWPKFWFYVFSALINVTVIFM